MNARKGVAFLPHPPLPAARKLPRRSTARAVLGGPLLLTTATGLGLLSTRARFIPASLRGAAVSFVSGAILRAPGESVLAHAPAAISLLLLTSGADTRSRPTKSLTLAFALGAFGTLVGASLGAALYPQYAPLAAAFCATYIGGSLNFVAVIAATGVSGAQAGAAITADLALMALYFAALFAVAARVSQTSPVIAKRGASHTNESSRVVCITATCLALLVHLATHNMNCVVRGMDVVLTTLLSLAVRRVIGTRWLARGAPAANIGVLVFFSALGGCVSFAELTAASSAPVFLLCLCTLVVHSLAIVLGRCLLRLSPKDLIVASNANVGGPTTAASFAGALGWADLVGPAAVMGGVGYAIATPLALCMLDVLRVLLRA